MIYLLVPAAVVNLSKDYICNRGPGPAISRPHSPPLSSQQPREGSPAQEVLRQWVGRDSQEGSPAPPHPHGQKQLLQPPLQVEEEADLQGRSAGLPPEALSPAASYCHPVGYKSTRLTSGPVLGGSHVSFPWLPLLFTLLPSLLLSTGEVCLSSPKRDT